VGKTHLLRATAAAANGVRPVHFSAGLGRSGRSSRASALILVDDVDRADAVAQGRLFTLYNG
jgi:hypothetical protein